MNLPAVVGRLERGVRPHAEMLARRLQAAAYSHGYEDAHPSNATTRQAKTDAVSRQTLADLLIAIAALGNQAALRAATMCSCREGECESKPTGCRMAAEIGTDAQ